MLGLTRTVTDLGAQGAYLTNLDIPGRRVRALYLTGLLLATFPAVFGYVTCSGQTESVAFLPATYSIIAIVVVWVLNKCLSAAPRNWLSGEAAFVLTFTMFHFTYLVYYSFEWAPADPEVFLVPATVWRATLFCILSLVAFLMAYELTGLGYPRLKQLPRLIPPPLGAITAGKMLVILCVLFMFSVMLSVGIGNLMSDYKLLMHIGYTTGGRFFWVAITLGGAVLAIYCSASGLLRQKATSGLLGSLIASGFVLLELLLGDRGSFIFLAVIPTLAFHYFQRRIGLPLVVLLAIGTLFVSGIIAMSRDTVTMSATKMYEQYKYESGQEDIGTVSRTLLEFGVSIKTVVIAMDLVPQQYPYWYGASFWDSALIALPNIIPGQVRTSQSIAVWLNEAVFGQSEDTWGRGGSIAMELYLNFGFVGGVICFALLGACYRALYERFLRKPNFMRTVLLLASYSAMVLWVRNTSALVPRNMLWPLAITWLLQQYLARRAPAPLAPAGLPRGPGGLGERGVALPQ